MIADFCTGDYPVFVVFSSPIDQRTSRVAGGHINFCRLFLSLGPFIPHGKLPFASLHSGGRTVKHFGL